MRHILETLGSGGRAWLLGIAVWAAGGLTGCDAASPLVTAAPPAEAADDTGGVHSPAQPAPAKRPAATEKQPQAKPAEEPEVDEHPFPRRVKAPSLDGGVGWINTGGPLDLQDLRGKFVVLDFWTYCCINCIHVLPELKKLERAYPREVVVIGVHSAKFEGEQDTKNITDAVLRYEIEHPVVNDARHAIWDKYGVNSWPTLMFIDPEGYAVFASNGETQFELMDRFMKLALPYYDRRGLVDRTPLRFDLAAHQARATPLRFPGKVLADEAGGRLFITDSNHNRIVVARLDGTLLETIGSGAAGRADGDYQQATFDHPQGTALHGQTLYVADTENHLLRKVDLARKRVSTIAGTGRQGGAWPGLEALRVNPLAPRQLPDRWVGPPRETALNSPWALWVHKQDLYIAMAGPHQIWKMPLDEQEIGPYAGNGREDIVDGPLLPAQPYQEGYSSFAQPSGLSGDDRWLYVADSEGSSIRAVPFDPQGEVKTIVGTADQAIARLFTFGDVDGRGGAVRLQHALEVVHVEGKLYVADTYNNKIKLVDPKDASSRTLVGTGQPGLDDAPATFDEPAGLSYAAGKLYVADTNNHAIRVVDLRQGNKVSTLAIRGLRPPRAAVAAEDDRPSIPDARPVQVEPVEVQPQQGKLRVKLSVQLPDGYKLNAAAPMRYLVEAQAEKGLVARGAIGKLQAVSPPGTTVEFELPVAGGDGEDQLRISWAVYYCQEGSEGLCKAGAVAWTVPVRIRAGAAAKQLDLSWDVARPAAAAR